MQHKKGRIPTRVYTDVELCHNTCTYGQGLDKTYKNENSLIMIMIVYIFFL